MECTTKWILRFNNIILPQGLNIGAKSGHSSLNSKLTLHIWSGLQPLKEFLNYYCHIATGKTIRYFVGLGTWEFLRIRLKITIVVAYVNIFCGCHIEIGHHMCEDKTTHICYLLQLSENMLITIVSIYFR